ERPPTAVVAAAVVAATVVAPAAIVAAAVAVIPAFLVLGIGAVVETVGVRLIGTAEERTSVLRAAPEAAGRRRGCPLLGSHLLRSGLLPRSCFLRAAMSLAPLAKRLSLGRYGQSQRQRRCCRE